MKVCICGGGNVAHSLAATLSEQDEVSVLTRNPSAWSSRLAYTKSGGALKYSAGNIAVSADAAVVTEAELIIVTLPQFAVRSVIDRIKGFLRARQALLIVPAPAGVSNIVDELTQLGVNCAVLQRVPYVARIREYGHFVDVSSDRSVHTLVVSEEKQWWQRFVSSRFGGKVVFRQSFLSYDFSNSNPLIHPSRLVVLLKGGKSGCYERMPYFYSEWTNESSLLYLRADEEMLKVIKAYPGINVATDYESVCDHYEVPFACRNNLEDAASWLTNKIRSIESLRSIKAPWVKDESGLYVPDYSSRYFTEDVPYGTVVIKQRAEAVGIDTPTINMLIATINEFAFRK